MTARSAQPRPARRIPRASRRTWLWLCVALVALAALAAAWRYTPLNELLTFERIRGWARVVRHTPWAPLVLVAAYTPAAFLMFPRPVLTLLSVLAFGSWLGFGYSMAGILIAAMTAFSLGRLLPSRTTERLAGRYAEPVKKTLRRHGVVAVIVMRALPTAPDVVESILAGALRVKAWHFAVGTFVGMLPGVVAMSVFGGQLSVLLHTDEKASYWLAGGALAFFVVTAWLIRRWAARQ